MLKNTEEKETFKIEKQINNQIKKKRKYFDLENETS